MDNNGGRPRKEINREVFETMLEYQAPMSEVLARFEVSRNTIRSWVRENYEGRTYEEVAESLQSKGLLSLRSALFSQARRNAAVAIFLAKNLLGMSDDPHPVDTGEERKEFASAIKAATKALSCMDIASIADVPPSDDDHGEGNDG